MIGYVESNPRNVYRFIKSRKTNPIGISLLKYNYKVLMYDGDKADCSNRYFSFVFTTENDKARAILSSPHPTMLDIINY